MNLKKLTTELSKIGKDRIDFNRLLVEAGLLKKKAISHGDELLANKLWVYESILTAHQYYNEAFKLLRQKKYVQGWNLLERAEIEIGGLKNHLHLVKENYKIKYVENMVQRLQTLFPYRLFASSELLEKEIKCSICEQRVSLRNPCGHRVGELYMGERCLRIVSECDVLGIALVENPVNKYSVMFNESEDLDFRDKEQFGLVNYILSIVKSPYDQWRVEISEKFFPHESYDNLKADDECPCNSGEKYQNCCLAQPGVSGFDYQFRVNNNALARAAAKKL